MYRIALLWLKYFGDVPYVGGGQISTPSCNTAGSPKFGHLSAPIVFSAILQLTDSSLMGTC